MMSKTLMRIALAEFTESEFVVKSLNTPDADLKKVEPKIEFPSQRGMKEIEDLRIFDNPQKYHIPDLNADNPYFILSRLFDFDYSQAENKLESIDDIDFKKDDSFKPNLVAYYFIAEDKTETVYLTSVKQRQLIIEDKIYFRFGKKTFKKHSGPERAIPIEVSEVEEGLDLPMSNFLCEVSKRSDKYSLKIYNASVLDKELKLTSEINKAAYNTLERFNARDENQFSITKAGIGVEITNIEAVKNLIEQENNFKLSKSLSLYTGHGNRTINQIDKEQLIFALDRLKEHIDDEGNPYGESDIPELISDENLIRVTGNQIRIFAALLENKIVEKILDKKIDLPFFDYLEHS